MPSTRYLSGHLSIARNILINVFEQLEAEGFLYSIKGSGTYVAQGSYLNNYNSIPSAAIKKDKEQQEIPLSNIIDFYSHKPDLQYFPIKKWMECIRSSYNNNGSLILDYIPKKGLVSLRETWSQFLERKKGIYCHPEQIIITSGTAMSMSILAQILKSDFDRIYSENPGMIHFKNIFKQNGFKVLYVDVNEHGILKGQIEKIQNQSVILSTPSHQFPMGTTLPIQHRIQLINHARESKSIIIENDYHLEFRYKGYPVNSLYLLDSKQVIHLGSFKGLMFPSLCLGYMILPEQFIEPFNKKIKSIPIDSSALNQAALNIFIEKGYLDRHIHKMKRLYENKRQFLIKTLKSNFNSKIQILGDSSGLHLTVSFNNIVFDKPVIEAIINSGVRVGLVDSYAVQRGRHKDKLVFCYGGLDNSQIEEGIDRIRQVLFER